MDEENERQQQESLADWESILLSEEYSESEGEESWFATLVGTEEAPAELVETAAAVPQESAEEPQKVAPEHPVEEGLEELQLEKPEATMLLEEEDPKTTQTAPDIFKIDYVVKPATLQRLRQSFSLHFSHKRAMLTSQASPRGKGSKRRSKGRARRQLVEPKQAREASFKLWPENQLALPPLTFTEAQPSLMDETVTRAKEEVPPHVPQGLLSFEKVGSRQVEEKQAPHPAKVIEKPRPHRPKAKAEKQAPYKTKAVVREQVPHKSKLLQAGAAKSSLLEMSQRVQPNITQARVKPLALEEAQKRVHKPTRNSVRPTRAGGLRPTSLEAPSNRKQQVAKQESLSLEGRTSAAGRQHLSIAAVASKAKSQHKRFTSSLALEAPKHKNSSRLELTSRRSARKEML